MRRLPLYPKTEKEEDRTMVDLRKKPFELDDGQLKWVEDTIASMSLEEKIGQLFI